MRKMLAMVLCIALCLTVLAACSTAKEKKPTVPQDPPSMEQDQQSEGNQFDTNLTDPGEETPGEPEDLAEISVWLFDVMNNSEENWARITNAINAITEDEIGVHVEFVRFSDFMSYNEQISLAITSGEPMDLIMNMAGSSAYSTMSSSGQLLDIAPYLNEYGTGLLENVGDYMNAFKMGDSIYGVPAFKEFSSNVYIFMRKDVLEELSLVDAAENMTSFTEFEQILQAVTENTDYAGIAGMQSVAGFEGVINGDDLFANYFCYDPVVRSFGNDLIYAEGGTIKALYENEAFKQQCARFADWYEAGYVWPDTYFNTESTTSIVKSGAAFSYVFGGTSNIVNEQESELGMEVVAAYIGSCMATTTAVQGFALSCPVTSSDPEAAVKFMNLMFTDSRIINLMDWGIEGEDYVVVDGVATFPANNPEGTGLFHSRDILYGNSFLALPWDGSAADARETALASMRQVPTSPYLGFAVDTSEMDYLIASLQSVEAEYAASLRSGLYTEEMYTEYVSALEAAGVVDYMAQIQAQLDAWMQ